MKNTVEVLPRPDEWNKHLLKKKCIIEEGSSGDGSTMIDKLKFGRKSFLKKEHFLIIRKREPLKIQKSSTFKSELNIFKKNCCQCSGTTLNIF
jgi:hypothetical protein